MRHSILITTVLGSVACATFALAQQRPQRPPTPSDADTLVTMEDMQSILKNVPDENGKPGGLSAQLFGKVGNCAFIRIVAADTPHAHGDTSEIYVIQSGTASIETGGEMVGPFNANSAVHQRLFVNPDGSPRAPGSGPTDQAAPAGVDAGAAAAGGAGAGGDGGGRQGGNRPPPMEGGPHNGAGTAVAGGRIQVVHAGDVIMIPAGVPHHWVKVDKPVVYLDIKFPEIK